jgi:predicted unusual protein kinase regulating ubiquinone biosynthesis (AarF/ABC1/UbiB family)
LEYLEESQKRKTLSNNFQTIWHWLATVKNDLLGGVQCGNHFELVKDGPTDVASIGQVYEAHLKANGNLVAIEIQCP